MQMTTRQYARQTLASYALFDNARQRGQSPQHALVPLVLPFLIGKSGQQFLPDALATSLQPIFGSQFTAYAAEALSLGLLAEGYLREGARNGDGALYFYTEKVDELRVDESVLEAERDISIIIEEFLQFLEATSPIFRAEYNFEEWKNLFIQWATNVDVNDKDELKIWVDSIVDGNKKERLSISGNMDAEERFFGIDKHIVVLFASFSQWLSRERIDLFAKVATLAEIGFLMDLVSELRDPVKPAPQKIDLTVVFDGPLLLDAVGLMGVGRAQAASSVLSLCKKHGIGVVALQHSIEEAKEIVQAVLGKAPGQRYGMVADTIRGNIVSERRASNFVAKPDQEVKGLGIQILNANILSSIQSKEIFNDSEIERFASGLPYYESMVGNRKARDAKSIAYIIRRRGGNYTSDAFSSKFLFLTRSSVLVRYSDVYCRRKVDGWPSYAIPPAVEMRHFSTLFLLAYGTSEGERISRGELLSSCELVLKTSPLVIKRVRETVEQLSLFSTEQLDAVMGDPVALREITIATGNDPEVVTAENASEVARIIREAAAKDERLKAQRERLAVSIRHEEAMGAALADSERARLDAAKAGLQLQRGAVEARETAAVLIGQWHREADSYWLIVTILFCAISITAMASVFLNSIQINIYVKVFVWICVSAIAIYSLSNRIIENFSILSLRKIIRTRVVASRAASLPQGGVRENVEILMRAK
ncbi:hypothetical protein G5B46_05240 [Caulobacter sp. 602-2]|uniref:Uncharacterized protein n=1 Tax=Caulobacter sp. 602-2 TaxID=2710887 RepID=A0A6G4QTM8_9CAUL|nr:hypothetical protein [Caulobacter sp. 602-2]NGM49006.1 hypothetical protein [Caulobacter sp. 602-2]